MDTEMFTDPRMLDCRDAVKPTLSVITCTRCGCLVADADIHEQFHKNHGHSGFSFTKEWSK